MRGAASQLDSPAAPPPPAPAGGGGRSSIGLWVAACLVAVAAVGVGAVLVGRARGHDDVATGAEAKAPATSVVSPGAPARPSTTLPGGLVLDQSCTSPGAGYSLRYPGGWTAELSFPGWQCALFDPNPFTVQPDTEPPNVAIAVSVSPAALDETTAQYTDPGGAHVLSTNAVTIAERPAVALELVTTQDVLLPAGTTRYVVLVDMGGRTLVMETDDAARAGYSADKVILRAMAATLQFD